MNFCKFYNKTMIEIWGQADCLFGHTPVKEVNIIYGSAEIFASVLTYIVGGIPIRILSKLCNIIAKYTTSRCDKK